MVVRGDLHIELGSILTPVSPDPGLAEARIQLVVCDVQVEPLDVIARPDVLDRHRQKLGARIAIRSDGDVVDREETVRLVVEHPHRARVALEEQPVALLCMPPFAQLPGIRCLDVFRELFHLGRKRLESGRGRLVRSRSADDFSQPPDRRRDLACKEGCDALAIGT